MLLPQTHCGPTLEMAVDLLQKTQAGSLARASQGSTSSLPAGMLLLLRTQHAGVGKNHHSAQVWDEMIGLEGVREDGFGLTPRPAIPDCLSGDNNPVLGLLSGGHMQKLLRVGEEQMGNNMFPKVVSQRESPGCPWWDGANTRALYAPEPVLEPSHLPLPCSATAGGASRFAVT